MDRNDYSSLEKYYIYPQHIEKYKLKSHLHEIEDILETNQEDYSKLKIKKYYYFLMPSCGHPQKISLTNLKRQIENKNFKNLHCRVCKLLFNSNLFYQDLAAIYSVNNEQPLSKIKRRMVPIIFTCPECNENTQYDELRWVLEGLKDGRPFRKFCKKRCFSIGVKYPKLVDLWDENKNKISIFSIPASDENLYHIKQYFKCAVCIKSTDTPTTVYNIIQNSSKCIEHKANPMSSFAEQAILLSFNRSLSKFPFIKIFNKYKYHRNCEFDIFIIITINNKDYKFAIENDGKHHRNRVKEDEAKNDYANENTIHLERVRDLELRNIKLKNFDNIIQRLSKSKEELNYVIPELLNRFFYWLSSLLILESEDLINIKKSIENEIETVDVIKDENIIFKKLSSLPKNLLKDDPNLSIIYTQLQKDVRDEMGDFITVTEQDIKRPFICHICGYHWEQYVYAVVKNFKNSKGNATGCPACANKDPKQINELKNISIFLKNKGLTQKEIGIKLRRSQSTISSWLNT